MAALPDPFSISVSEYLEWESTQQLSAAECLDWESTPQDRDKYWHARVREMSWRTRNHKRILDNWSNLALALSNRDFDLYTADVKVQGEPGAKYFYPDVVVCERTNGDAETAQFPCLIVEVLSPSTEAIDRGAKFEAYRQLKSLQEYILVQADRPKVEIFRRNGLNQWVLSEHDLDDRLLLESIGVEIAISDLYRYVQFDPDEWTVMI